MNHELICIACHHELPAAYIDADGVCEACTGHVAVLALLAAEMQNQTEGPLFER